MTTTVLNVPDVSCEHCEKTIVGTLSPVAGITSVKVDIPTKQVTVEFDPNQVSVDTMKDVLKDEDYPVA